MEWIWSPPVVQIVFSIWWPSSPLCSRTFSLLCTIISDEDHKAVASPHHILLLTSEWWTIYHMRPFHPNCYSINVAFAATKCHYEDHCSNTLNLTPRERGAIVQKLGCIGFWWASNGIGFDRPATYPIGLGNPQPCRYAKSRSYCTWLHIYQSKPVLQHVVLYCILTYSYQTDIVKVGVTGMKVWTSRELAS